MTQPTRDAIASYEDMLTRFLLLKKQNRTFPGDSPPDPKHFGLDEWIASQVRARVEKEMDR